MGRHSSRRVIYLRRRIRRLTLLRGHQCLAQARPRRTKETVRLIPADDHQILFALNCWQSLLGPLRLMGKTAARILLRRIGPPAGKPY